MKKILIAMLAVALLLCGCVRTTTPAIQTQPQTQPTSPSTAATTAATEPTYPTAEIRQTPIYAISLPVISESESAENGEVIFEHIYQNISSLTLPEPEVANKIILDFYNRADAAQTVLQLQEQAKEDHATQPNGNWPYRYATVYKPERLDSSVLSLSGYVSSYSGGTHPESIGKSATYDLLTGNTLNISGVLQETATIEELLPLIYDALKPQSETLFEGYETMVAEKFRQGIDQNPDWYFSDTGLCFFFSPYEIAPFASGTVVAQIPYTQLLGILRDEYFPAERDIAAGKLQVIPYETAALDDYSQFTELTLASGGKKYLLVTDSTVQDVRIYFSQATAPAYGYTTQYTVFAAYGLTVHDAIVLETDEPVTVSYRSGNEIFTVEIGK